jgi:1-aminocyclopropane-1-carboxylate deaminase/D-cysteine desulfhydrase-like pyridoxal-dependent ACC family enzyme
VSRASAESGTGPLVGKFPSLSVVPRVALGRFPTPVQPLAQLASSLWIKRDDLNATPFGGNKVRALEFLLAGLRAGDRVVTVGSAGSTHSLAVATYGSALGARTVIGRWRQEMNDTAARVASRIERTADETRLFPNPAGAYLWAWRRARGARWISAGGSTPLGVLGHVNAGLELAEQINAGELPAPAAVVVPLGTGGTAAGLALAFAIAGLDVRVVGVRVVPWIVGRRGRVLRLARRTASLIERTTGVSVPAVGRDAVHVVNDAYGGAYGRETQAARAAAGRLADATGVRLDATYSAKAFEVALRLAAREPVLFWLTFDSRLLDVR